MPSSELGADMRRREFLGVLGGAAAAWPLAARAQQPAMPVIGFLSPTSSDAMAERLRGFRQGLKDTGYVEGENVAIEYRWAENQFDRLPALAADLVRRRVAVIAAAGGNAAAFAAKAATTTIPIVFIVGEDPVKLGLVASLARPGGNLTGINFFTSELAAKRLELAARVGAGSHSRCRARQSDNRRMPIPRCETWKRRLAPSGLQIQVSQRQHQPRDRCGLRNALCASGPTPFSSASTLSSTAGASNWSTWRRAMRSPRRIPVRDFAEAGGLMSYGANIADAYRQVGVYAGRILKGAKPADLPVVQSNKFELVINAETARMLGLTVPPSLLARADEVIE